MTNARKFDNVDDLKKFLSESKEGFANEKIELNLTKFHSSFLTEELDKLLEFKTFPPHFCVDLSKCLVTTAKKSIDDPSFTDRTMTQISGLFGINSDIFELKLSNTNLLSRDLARIKSALKKASRTGIFHLDLSENEFMNRKYFYTYSFTKLIWEYFSHDSIHELIEMMGILPRKFTCNLSACAFDDKKLLRLTKGLKLINPEGTLILHKNNITNEGLRSALHELQSVTRNFSLDFGTVTFQNGAKTSSSLDQDLVSQLYKKSEVPEYRPAIK